MRDLAARRLARLGEASHRLAAVAAVIRRPFDFTLLREAAGLSNDETAARVDELIRRGVLGVSGEKLDFTHDRLREVAYEEIVPPLRPALHAAVARALAQRSGDDETLALNLAFHHRGMGAWQEAADGFQRAGRRALARAAFRTAAADLEQALTMLERLPETPARMAQGVDLRLDLRQALVPLHDATRIRTVRAEAEAIAARVGDRRRGAWVTAYRAYALMIAGDPARAEESARRAAEIGQSGPDDRLVVYAEHCLAFVAYASGDFRGAVALARPHVRRRERSRRRRSPSARGSTTGSASSSPPARWPPSPCSSTTPRPRARRPSARSRSAATATSPSRRPPSPPRSVSRRRGSGGSTRDSRSWNGRPPTRRRRRSRTLSPIA
ncbi:MAG: hypothetical protein FJZ38_03005 [Candidatus Rokubacteria bacterium]|nr:hypothetical protein [Candidatus Rokubacteria bacterium]